MPKSQAHCDTLRNVHFTTLLYFDIGLPNSPRSLFSITLFVNIMIPEMILVKYVLRNKNERAHSHHSTARSCFSSLTDVHKRCAGDDSFVDPL